jgi:hypothetical protein
MPVEALIARKFSIVFETEAQLAARRKVGCCRLDLAIEETSAFAVDARNYNLA